MKQYALLFIRDNTKSKAEKFNTKDRQLLIEEIERIQGVKLEVIKPSRKLYKSSNGLFYLIFGGSEDWHGIRKNTLEKLKILNASGKENVFIVAKKFRTQIDVFVGSLSIFLNGVHKLRETKSDSLQFHCAFTEDGLFLEEMQN